MNEFVLFFRMDILNVEVSYEQMKGYMTLWNVWINKIDSQGHLAEGGNHLSKEGRVLKSNRINIDMPYVAENNSIVGYILILAENMDEATLIAQKCPILSGENTSVEIRQVSN